MRQRHVVVVLCASVVACTAPPPAELPYEWLSKPDSAGPVGWWAQTRPAIPELATHALAANVRELRLSTGGSWILNEERAILRLYQTPGRTGGEVLFYRCVLAPGDAHVENCRWHTRVGRPRRRIDWGGVLARLDSLDLDRWQPDAYERLNAGWRSWNDAGELLVEVRHGMAYRAFSVNAPLMRRDAWGRRAAPVARLVDSLIRLAQ